MASCPPSLAAFLYPWRCRQPETPRQKLYDAPCLQFVHSGAFGLILVTMLQTTQKGEEPERRDTHPTLNDPGKQLNSKHRTVSHKRRLVLPSIKCPPGPCFPVFKSNDPIDNRKLGDIFLVRSRVRLSKYHDSKPSD